MSEQRLTFRHHVLEEQISKAAESSVFPRALLEVGADLLAAELLGSVVIYAERHNISLEQAIEHAAGVAICGLAKGLP